MADAPVHDEKSAARATPPPVQSSTLQTSDEATYNIASQLLLAVQGLLKEAEDLFREPKQQACEAQRSICEPESQTGTPDRSGNDCGQGAEDGAGRRDGMKLSRRWFWLSINFPLTIQRTKNQHTLSRYNCVNGPVLTLECKGDQHLLMNAEREFCEKVADAMAALRR
jgi:hypothetical protein